MDTLATHFRLGKKGGMRIHELLGPRGHPSLAPRKRGWPVSSLNGLLASQTSPGLTTVWSSESAKTVSRTMSRYIRWDFRRCGKQSLVIYIHGHLGFPYLLIDRQREHLGVSCSFEWWGDDERFYCGFQPCVLILDFGDHTFTVSRAGWFEEGIPVVITAPVEVEISVEELKTIYRATCRRSGRKPLGLDDIHSRRQFIQRVLAGRGMAN